MKKIFLIILAVLIASPVQSGFLVGSGASGGGACSTPSDGDEFNEGFIGTGYENSWSETIGTNGTINEDASLTGTPPAGSCTEGLLTSVTTSGGITHTYADTGSAITDGTTHDIKAEFRINSYTLPVDADEVVIATWSPDSDVAGTNVVDVRLRNVSSTLGIKAYGLTNSGNTEIISTGTWYTLTIHLNATAASSYLQIDSGTQRSFTRNSQNGQYLFLGPGRYLDSDEAVAIEWGRVWVNTP